MNVRRISGFGLLAGSLLSAAGSCLAALGGSANSIPGDAAQLQTLAVAKKAARPELYSVQRLTLSNATDVDEYVSSSTGQVFAVRWHGPRPPDLSVLFGSYYDEYAAAAAQPHTRSAELHIDTGRMVYRVGGHMRSYSGLAHVPALTPAGITAEDLQ